MGIMVDDLLGFTRTQLGTIEVRSSDADGTSFTVKLPRA